MKGWTLDMLLRANIAKLTKPDTFRRDEDLIAEALQNLAVLFGAKPPKTPGNYLTLGEMAKILLDNEMVESSYCANETVENITCEGSDGYWQLRRYVNNKWETKYRFEPINWISTNLTEL